MIINVGGVVDISLLFSMSDRVPALATPSAMHPESWQLGAQVETWARGRGLVLGDPDTSPLGRARCERLAARIFPSADLAAVELFARWLTWTLALDDTMDHPPLADSGSAVHALYDDLLRAMRRGHARPGARPLEGALVELWQATSKGMSRDWRRRFMLHLEAHRDGCAEESVNRRIRHVPTEKEFPPLRRRACGPFLYDLVEPVLGVELPGGCCGRRGGRRSRTASPTWWPGPTTSRPTTWRRRAATTTTFPPSWPGRRGWTPSRRPPPSPTGSRTAWRRPGRRRAGSPRCSTGWS